MAKLYRTLGIVAVLTLTQFVLASPPVPPKALGQIEARIDFCIRVDSASADKYNELKKALVADMSEKELKDTRESSDYKVEYGAMTDRMEKIPQDKAVEGCRAGLNDAAK